MAKRLSDEEKAARKLKRDEARAAKKAAEAAEVEPVVEPEAPPADPAPQAPDEPADAEETVTAPTSEVGEPSPPRRINNPDPATHQQRLVASTLRKREQKKERDEANYGYKNRK